MDFDGKTILITGGGRGIGRSLARDFAAAGARVVVNYAASAKGAEETVHDIEADGGGRSPWASTSPMSLP